MKILAGGVTKPRGFKANGMACGIKKSGKADLSLIVSDVPCTACGVFTKNSIIAAPLVVTKKHLANGVAQAIIANSGNANCFTDEFGLTYATKMAEEAATHLKIKTSDVIIASTGIIGKALPINKITTGIPRLVNSMGSASTKAAMAAKAIMTTDTVVKEAAVQFSIGSHTATIGGCAKGSGMIEPNMATMLAFLTSDVAIDKTCLKKALKIAVDQTFNTITVDGCMSTNDMVTIMANGQAENSLIKTEGKHFDTFCEALILVCKDLAQKIVKDGEGAKKVIEITVSGAATQKEANTAAKTIANSNLVKTAAYGKDANWGRIAAAVGSLRLKISEKTLKITAQQTSPRNIQINVDLGLGQKSATVLTCDLTGEYVRINSEYN